MILPRVPGVVVRLFRVVAGGAITALVAVTAASPAGATTAVAFRGTAAVCVEETFGPKPSAPGCPDEKPQGMYHLGQPGGPNILGPGLRLNFANTDKWTERHGNWQMESDECTKFNPVAEAMPVACALDLVGQLGPVLGIGAACGMSAGFGGNGRLESDNDSVLYVSDLGWPFTVGGVLPVTGLYTVGSGKNEQVEKPEMGRVLGLVFAQGGLSCIKNPFSGEGGASQFNVMGFLWFGF